MPSQAYALEEGGPKRLGVQWKAFWEDLTVQLDGVTIGAIPDRKQLSAGQEFQLPDGSTLKVQLARTLTSSELRVLRDGQPLPGSASAPETKLRLAYSVVFFIAGINIVLGLVASVFQIELLQSMGLGLASFIVGIGFTVLGFLTRRRSTAALVVAIALFALDGVLGFISSLSPAYVIARLFLLVPMAQGIGAIRSINKRTGLTKRKTKVIAGAAVALLLLCVGTGTVGTLVTRAVAERIVITNPSKVGVAAKSIADYDLPPGYKEIVVLDFFRAKVLIVGPAESPSGDALGPGFMLLQTAEGWPDKDELGQEMRATIEQQWRSATFTVQHASTERAVICGQEVTLFAYEGIDEEGNEWRQVASDWFEVSGKPTSLLTLGLVEVWDQAQVDAFARSIR
jgi:hypothetical protein